CQWPATAALYPLPLPAALPISLPPPRGPRARALRALQRRAPPGLRRRAREALAPSAMGDGGTRPAGPRQSSAGGPGAATPPAPRSEEHTSELQSRENLVCRLLL